MTLPREDDSRQRAVLVLGAGRSGTSIVTRAMQAVGVELGSDFKPPSRKNPTGFFEDAALLKLSKRLRRTLGLRPDSLRLLDDSEWASPKVMPFYAEFSATIKERFDDAPLWGFKYARTMRLLPFWERLFEQMDISPSYVMAIRNPLSVARSRAKLDAHRGQQEHAPYHRGNARCRSAWGLGTGQDDTHDHRRRTQEGGNRGRDRVPSPDA